jgi:hypothetical protein
VRKSMGCGWNEMKTLLYFFALIWFVIGLGVLVSGQQLGVAELPGGMPSSSGGAAHAAVAAIWYWLWAFPMPSLLAGALGAVLGRLDGIRDALEFADEQDAPDDRPPMPDGRVDPYIGDGYVSGQTDARSQIAHKNPPAP